LQVLHAKATLLQTQTCLVHDALELKNLQQLSEPVLVQNPIFEDDVDSDQQSAHEPLIQKTPDSIREKDQLPLSKWIIRPWEEIRKNKYRTCIGYEKDVTFHNPDCTKPIQFQSAGLLQESSDSLAPVQEQILICQHC
jgi:hypothetical protein